MIELLISGNFEDAWKLFEAILDEASKSTFIFFRLSISRLAFAILGTGMDLDNNGQPQINVYNFVMKIDQMETKDDIRKTFYGMFDVLKKRQDEKRRLKYDVTTEKIIEIINERYSDINLSLQMIADGSAILLPIQAV